MHHSWHCRTEACSPKDAPVRQPRGRKAGQAPGIACQLYCQKEPHQKMPSCTSPEAAKLARLPRAWRVWEGRPCGVAGGSRLPSHTTS